MYELFDGMAQTASGDAGGGMSVRTYPPRPMTNPCLYCGRTCASSDNYRCDIFRIMFQIEWEQTVAFLREKMGLKK